MIPHSGQDDKTSKNVEMVHYDKHFIIDPQLKMSTDTDTIFNDHDTKYTVNRGDLAGGHSDTTSDIWKSSSRGQKWRQGKQKQLGYLGKVLKNTGMKNDVWKHTEISGEDEDTYMSHLQQQKHNLASIGSELNTACVCNHIRKLQILCHLLDDLDIKVTSPKLRVKDKSPVQTALLNDSKEAVKLLLDHGGADLALFRETNETYRDATILHQLIITGNRELIHVAMSKLDKAQQYQVIHMQASGDIFTKHFKVGGQCLVLALWCGYKDIFDDLLGYGAELDAKDEYSGNTAIHTLISFGIHNPKLAVRIMQDILDGEPAKRWFCKKAQIDEDRFTKHTLHEMKNYILKIENHEGFTPLTLSGKMGVQTIMVYLLHCEGVYKHTVWRFGPSSYCLYDMTNIDPAVGMLLHEHKPNLLDLIVYASGDDNLSALSIQPIKKLIRLKWETQRLFYAGWCVVHILTMCMFYVVPSSMAEWEYGYIDNIAIPIDNTTIEHVTPANVSFEALDPILGFFEISFNVGVVVMVVLGVAVIYLLLELYDISHSIYFYIQCRLRRKTSGYYKAPIRVIIKFDEFRVILTAFSILTITWTIPQSIPQQQTLLAVAVVLGWYFVLFFTRAFEPTGFFTVMLHRILFTDVLRFGIVFGVILAGFSAAMIATYSGHDGGLPTEFYPFGNAMMTMFRLMIGLEEFNILFDASNRILASVLFVVFVALATILLMNMLIAAMSDTYGAISGSRMNLWRKMRVASIMLMERRSLPCVIRYNVKRYLQWDEDKHIWVLPVEETKTL